MISNLLINILITLHNLTKPIRRFKKCRLEYITKIIFK